jgi:hypothetical protein
VDASGYRRQLFDATRVAMSRRPFSLQDRRPRVDSPATLVGGLAAVSAAALLALTTTGPPPLGVDGEPAASDSVWGVFGWGVYELRGDGEGELAKRLNTAKGRQRGRPGAPADGSVLYGSPFLGSLLVSAQRQRYKCAQCGRPIVFRSATDDGTQMQIDCLHGKDAPDRAYTTWHPLTEVR